MFVFCLCLVLFLVSVSLVLGVLFGFRVMYLYICVHTLDPEISVSGPWPFLLQVSPDLFGSFMAIRPRRVLHRGPVASYCPVILHPEASVSHWHLSSFLVGQYTLN